ncbi:cysteine--tRNA ligase [Candidatus Woesearchaeota archaeon]|nr:cysteine--tRNA ligase [Candidatus Woesearchaeota archaeon]
MALMLYNTLSRKKEPFREIEKGKVRMYTCGPTVYDYAHVGNFRAYMAADVLKRYLTYLGYAVRHVMNLTDVDDKTIRGSQREGIPLKQYTERYIKAFFEDLKTLNIDPADIFPKATEHLEQMFLIIKGLMDKGIAYLGDDGCVYYNVRKFKGYGKLSRIHVDRLKAGARVTQDEYEKESANDFALWKAYTKDDGDVKWDSPWGPGRPGWHIECSAMSTEYLGDHFDIHTGGVDLVFPHHENEIAQSEGCSGHAFVNYWLHNEWLLVEGKKMSKSLGNFYTLRDVLRMGHSPKAIRYLLLATHYKVPLNFTEDGLAAAESTVKKFRDFLTNLDAAHGTGAKGTDALVREADTGFRNAMDDDLSISEALAAVFSFMKGVNKLLQDGKLSKADAKEVRAQMERFDIVLGILDFEEVTIGAAVEALIEEREKARVARDWKTADRIRDELKEKGIILEDGKTGVRWKRA